MNQIFKFSADYNKSFESPKYYYHPKHLSKVVLIYFQKSGYQTALGSISL